LKPNGSPQKEKNMHGRLTLNTAAFASLALLFACAAAGAQTQSRPGATQSPAPTPQPQNQSIINTTKSNTKDYRVATEAGEGGASGWDGKVQGRVLVTPLFVAFDSPADYDAFAAGRLRLNLVLRNALTGQTIRLDSRQLTEGFRPGADKGRLTFHVIVDNMTAPLSEEACGSVVPGAENTEGGVEITLSYSGCGGGTAQRPGNPITGIVVHGGKTEGAQMTAGQPIGGIVVKGGKNPGGNMTVAVGGSRVVTGEEAVAMSRAAGAIPANAGKGAGSPKNAGF
jgi:hypothetical protein